MRSTSSTRNNTATSSAGLTSGSVMAVKRCQAFAPSTRADSYNSSGITCNPASTSNAMNGVVFQMSPSITVHRAGQTLPVQMMLVPSTALTTPCGWNMYSHNLAVTAVGIAHGTKIAARTIARPLNARCITIAIMVPSTTSNSTVITVKINVVCTAGQNSCPLVPFGQLQLNQYR